MSFAEEELQHTGIGPFVSGPLDVGGVSCHPHTGLLKRVCDPCDINVLSITSGRRQVGKGTGHSFFPNGYSPPSIGSRHKARNLPKGTYGGRLVDDRPSGFGLALWCVSSSANDLLLSLRADWRMLPLQGGRAKI